MSRKRVIVGEDARGRPLSRWEDVPDEAPAYGHMQPAFDTRVERRKATAAELAASETTTHQTAAAPVPRPPSIRIRQEETTVETLPIADDTDPLTELVQAAIEADQAYEAFREAAPRWDAARARLEAAWRAASGEVLLRGETIPAPIVMAPTIAERSERLEAAQRRLAADAIDHVLASPDRLGLEAFVEPAPSKRQPGHHGGKPGEAAERAERARRVLEALETHGGNRQLAAASLGMRPNAFAMVLKHAELRQATSS